MREKKLVEINPKDLKNLRERLGFSIEEIAKRLRTTPEKIEQIEAGKRRLTLSQIKKLAKIYHISLAALFSDTIPEIPIVPDYRLNREKKLKPQVFLAQKRAYYLSKEIASLSNKRSEIPSFKMDIYPIKLAHRFREYLGIDVIKNKSSKEILRAYKSMIEERMFIPIIEYPLKAEDVRAFSMLSDIAVIVLNEQDKPQVRLFSLFHEIGHLLRKNSGLCSIEIEREWNNEETYCNQFAAEFLVPKSDLEYEIKSKNLSVFGHETVSALAKTYGVSKQVIMLRLLRFKYISKEDYENFKAQYTGIEERREFGRRNWEEVFFNRAGGLIIGEIKKAYKRGDITSVDVITTLGLEAKYVEKFVGS